MYLKHDGNETTHVVWCSRDDGPYDVGLERKLALAWPSGTPSFNGESIVHRGRQVVGVIVRPQGRLRTRLGDVVFHGVQKIPKSLPQLLAKHRDTFFTGILESAQRQHA